MAKKSKADAKKDAKNIIQTRRRRRQWLTFFRMCQYGINNFSRNAWLTIAATAVMTITLLIVFVTVAAQNVLTDTTTDISRRIDRSIYLVTGTTNEQAKPIIDSLGKLENVESVKFISSADGRANLAKDNKTDQGVISALTIANNLIPATIRVNLKNTNDTSQLVSFVNDNQELKKYIDPSRPPSFMGDRKSPTDTIAAWTRTAQEVGIVASVIFAAISILIIFNTIRMAIFNRKDEIEMMKLIGADKSFIRGPFVVEAIVYGFIAALIATGLGGLVLTSLRGKVADWGIVIEPTINLFMTYSGIVLLAMIVLGAIIGVISSLMATQRYLRI